MTTVTHTFDRPIIEVFDVLADPWTYPEWLVGAKEMRSVEPGWPSPGSSFHHRVGLVGPLTLADSSTSCEVEAPTRLVLEVRARPVGRAKVTFELTGTSLAQTEVAFSEEPIGAARLMKPVADPLALVRNKRSLEHLEEYLLRASGRS